MVGAKVFTMKKVTDNDSVPVYAQSSRFKTSRTELIHLAIGVSVFFIIEAPRYLQFGTMILLTIAGIITLAFALHELAHKFTAQNFGLGSEFRLDIFGTLISLLTAFSPFKIIAPGAVVVFGSSVTRENMGKIALAGPIANIVQILVFIFLSQFFPILWFAAILNADLAVFNLIPISVLDGRKILLWSKKVFTVVFITALTFWGMLRFIV
jgi:Zn-dependent protease